MRTDSSGRTLFAPMDTAVMVASCAFVVAMATVAVVAVRDGWAPAGDEAFIEMRVRDVPGDPPLVGVYSRFGWSHPGPALFYLLWLPYQLARSSSSGLIVAMVIGHGAAVLAATWIARRIDGIAAVATLLALQLVLVGTATPFVRTPWNPFVALVSSGLLVVCAWAAAQRRRWPTVALVPLGTVLVQAHLGTVPLVVVATVAALVLAAWGHGARTWSLPPWRPWAWSVGLAALLWVPPLVAQLRGAPGRASLLLSSDLEEGPRAGLDAALGVLTQAYALRPVWTDPAVDLEFGARLDPTLPVWLLVPLSGLAIAIVGGDRRFVRGLTIALASVGAGALGAAAISGIVHTYLVVGLRSSAAVSVALGLAAWAARWSAQRRVGLAIALAGLAVAASALLGVVQVDGDNPTPEYQQQLRGLAAAVLDSEAATRPLRLIAPEDTPGAEGVMLQLERSGVDVAVSEPDFRLRVGDRRVVPLGDDRTELVVSGTSVAEQLRAQGWQVLGECSGLVVAVRGDDLDPGPPGPPPTAPGC